MTQTNNTNGRGRKETVTVTFITNFEVNPEEFDLRVNQPEKIRHQLQSSIIPGSGTVQGTLDTREEQLLEYRREIEAARSVAIETEGENHKISDQ